MKKIFFAFLAVCLGAMTALSVPARKGVIDYTQPDGSVVRVTMTGDEFGCMIFSEDGQLLLSNDGRLEYAAFGADGVPYPSGIAVACGALTEAPSSQLQTPDQIEAWAAVMEKRRAEGREKRYGTFKGGTPVTSMTRGAESGDEETVRYSLGRFHDLIPTTGEQRLLVILVEYQDVNLKYGSYDYFNRMLNEEGFSDYGSEGSVRDWLIRNSNGQYAPQFDLYGPVKLPEKRKYYGADRANSMDPEAYMMAVHALQALDDEVDFSIYDCDKDGKIDNVFIIYAGYGADSAPDGDGVWPHFTFIHEEHDELLKVDGVELDQYGCCNEFSYGKTRPEGIGVFAHEFSHVLGLPDIYTFTLAFTPGDWSVIDCGNGNNKGLTPPNYSSFERAALGWMEFRAFREGEVDLPPLGDSNVAYAMPTDRETEIYLFENRQQTGFDTYLPGHGMLVWHIDYDENVWRSGFINLDDNHQNVDIVEADNKQGGGSRDGDAFPGTAHVTEFGFSTVPSLRSWSGERLAYDLYDISETPEGMIRFKVARSGEIPDGVEGLHGHRDGGKVWHDILGRTVSHPGKGLYIVDGKKVLVR